MIPPRIMGETLICPVCAKKFKVTSDTCYIVKEGYACSWQCFLDRVNENEDKPKETKRKKK